MPKGSVPEQVEEETSKEPANSGWSRNYYYYYYVRLTAFFPGQPG